MTIALAIFLIKDPLTQLTCSATFSILVIPKQISFYIFFTKPFKDNVQGTYLMLNELVTFFFYFTLGLSLFPILKISADTITRTCIKIILTSILLNLLCGTIQTLQKIYLKIKSFRQKRIRTPDEKTIDHNTAATKEAVKECIEKNEL